ncbi:MAG: 16S rRNA (cytidine(1402)-2'-O)-methyltransferase [SAR202 cluster bacterium Casp-Chloro-G4]|nr:16S rRNA (cytidine(1402)-2'-O)-methyltransferase [Chloroflexota bacterium]MDA1227617.1 16S rRNA (cytidine(1402)-2'-O)-methyltransferase [Chloroflexota bacterium]PKB61295.1 MAG: 16S rRNA (cytidine(1402)-2'-O)-methyltransferase [SAR202 cluster bacterium Casp-Chloro-G4]
MPKLFIVGTPIGNLEDITLRAIRVLKEVGLIAAEDTRVTRKLLSHFEIHTRLLSYNENNRAATIPKLLIELESLDIALVSDAGMPGINDPGHHLVEAARAAGFEVEAVPGPSAVTTAISVAGIPLEQFTYLGFLPRRKSTRLKLLDSMAATTHALVALETPHRLQASLADLQQALGDRRIAVCRELTKLHEEVFNGAISEAIEHFSEPRGEITLVIEGAQFNAHDDAASEDTAKQMLSDLRGQNVRSKEAVSTVVEATGLSRSRVYSLWVASQNDGGTPRRKTP